MTRSQALEYTYIAMSTSPRTHKLIVCTNKKAVRSVLRCLYLILTGEDLGPQDLTQRPRRLRGRGSEKAMSFRLLVLHDELAH